MSLEIVLISELIEGWLVILGLTPASDPLEDSLCSSECYIYIYSEFSYLYNHFMLLD